MTITIVFEPLSFAWHVFGAICYLGVGIVAWCTLIYHSWKSIDKTRRERGTKGCVSGCVNNITMIMYLALICGVAGTAKFVDKMISSITDDAGGLPGWSDFEQAVRRSYLYSSVCLIFTGYTLLSHIWISAVISSNLLFSCPNHARAMRTCSLIAIAVVDLLFWVFVFLGKFVQYASRPYLPQLFVVLSIVHPFVQGVVLLGWTLAMMILTPCFLVVLLRSLHIRKFHDPDLVTFIMRVSFFTFISSIALFMVIGYVPIHVFILSNQILLNNSVYDILQFICLLSIVLFIIKIPVPNHIVCLSKKSAKQTRGGNAHDDAKWSQNQKEEEEVVLESPLPSSPAQVGTTSDSSSQIPPSPERSRVEEVGAAITPTVESDQEGGGGECVSEADLPPVVAVLI